MLSSWAKIDRDKSAQNDTTADDHTTAKRTAYCARHCVWNTQSGNTGENWPGKPSSIDNHVSLSMLPNSYMLPVTSDKNINTSENAQAAVSSSSVDAFCNWPWVSLLFSRRLNMLLLLLSHAGHLRLLGDPSGLIHHLRVLIGLCKGVCSSRHSKSTCLKNTNTDDVQFALCERQAVFFPKNPQTFIWLCVGVSYGWRQCDVFFKRFVT